MCLLLCEKHVHGHYIRKLISWPLKIQSIESIIQSIELFFDLTENSLGSDSENSLLIPFLK